MSEEIRSSFMPSSLEHRPLMRVEKKELLRYLESDGKKQLGELMIGQYAESQELQRLEAWLWGVRFWGREALVRSTFPVLELLLPLWEKELQENGGDAVTQGIIFNTVIPPPAQLGAVMNWADRPGLTTSRVAWSRFRHLPSEWFEAEGRPLRQRIFFWIALAGNSAVQTVVAAPITAFGDFC